MLQLLELYPHLSEMELMERMGVDHVRVREYVTMLRGIGLVVEAEPLPGEGTVYALKSGKQMPPMMLRDAEIVAIVAALKFTQGLDTSANEGAENAIAKFERFLPQRLVERIEDVRQNLENAAPYEEDEDEGYDDDVRGVVNRYIATFTRAVQEHRQVWIRYYSWGNDEETKRTIDPYGLVQQKSKWYVVGYCHLRQDLRVFRLDNILDARLRTKTFDPPLNFDAVGFVAASLEKVSSS
jgi:predicted DNA-binding transcriptional regulator YafY